MSSLCAIDLMIAVPSVAPQDICATAYQRFTENIKVTAMAVVDAGKPIGILRRQDLLIRLSDTFGKSLFEDKPVTDLMDRDFIEVDALDSIDRLNTVIVEAQETTAVSDGFIITRRGVYQGMGTVVGLIESNRKQAEDRTFELNQTRLEAESADRARAAFLAHMSHELRTPLNAIIGFSDFILSHAGKATMREEDQETYIENIRESGEHLLRMVNAVLDISKLEADKFDLREDYEDPVEILKQSVRLVEATAHQNMIEIHLISDTNLPDLYADMQVVRQMVLNLLSNALKFSSKGSTITIGVILTQKGNMEFFVEDQGCGISEADLEMVIRPFMQADDYMVRKHQGAGLGLPLVNEFTRAHGGRFILESSLGVGTKATIVMPRQRIQHEKIIENMDVI